MDIDEVWILFLLNKLVLLCIGLVASISSPPFRWRGAGGMVAAGPLRLYRFWRGVFWIHYCYGTEFSSTLSTSTAAFVVTNLVLP